MHWQAVLGALCAGGDLGVQPDNLADRPDSAEERVGRFPGESQEPAVFKKPCQGYRSSNPTLCANMSLSPFVCVEETNAGTLGCRTRRSGRAACAAEGVGRMVPSWRDAGAGAMLARYSPADSERAAGCSLPNECFRKPTMRSTLSCGWV